MPLNKAELEYTYSRSRLGWIDQVKGFTIFLVVYGHNFPITEKYIYTFHMPLFIMAAGFFHPKEATLSSIKKRFRAIIIPYFVWASFLFAFWFLIGRNYGESTQFGLSPIKNFLGIFYSQGDKEYMNWGIPMWYLPALFITFLLLYGIQKIKNLSLRNTILCLLPIIGFAYTRVIVVNMPWSINIAMVALLFYAFGFYFFDKIQNLPTKHAALVMVSMGLINFMLYHYNSKIDMYRAYYGNELFFIVSGISGSLFVLFFFKIFPLFKFLEFIGKFSLVILALQGLAMTFIKLVLLLAFHQTDFDFSEWERFLYAILQIILLIPAFLLINKFLPVLNGGYKKI